MKQIQIIIPDRALKDVDEILREAQVGGLTHYRVEGRGTTQASRGCSGERYYEVYARIHTKD
jgi:nitrogen regulatory protein PII